ncbi:MAG: hypothetical protein Q8K70_12160 [Bacteroidota bacterium]|nr:hypothetical protein [Bacteroidota bacterium]
MTNIKIKPSEHLKQMILENELAQQQAELELRSAFKDSYDSLNPLNILKSTISSVISSPSIKTDILSSIIGFSSGFIAKKLFTRNSGNVLVNLEGMILQMIVANKVARNTDEISSVAGGIFQKIKNWLNFIKTSTDED